MVSSAALLLELAILLLAGNALGQQQVPVGQPQLPGFLQRYSLPNSHIAPSDLRAGDASLNTFISKVLGLVLGGIKAAPSVPQELLSLEAAGRTGAKDLSGVPIVAAPMVPKSSQDMSNDMFLREKFHLTGVPNVAVLGTAEKGQKNEMVGLSDYYSSDIDNLKVYSREGLANFLHGLCYALIFCH